MASLSMTGTGNPKDITEALINEIVNSAMSCELVERISRTLDNWTYDLLVFEKFYLLQWAYQSFCVCDRIRAELFLV